MNIDANRGLSFIDKLLCYGFAIGLLGLFYFLNSSVIDLGNYLSEINLVFVMIFILIPIALWLSDCYKITVLDYQLTKLILLILIGSNTIILFNYQNIDSSNYNKIVFSLIFFIIVLFVLVIVKSPVLAKLRIKSYEPKVKKEKPETFEKVNFK